MPFPVLMIILQAGSRGSSGGFFQFLPIILIFVVIYFLMIRPQSKRQKQQQAMLSSLKQGDKIVTIGGIHGTIAGIREKDKALIVKVNETTKMIFDRNAVARVVTETQESE